MFGKEEVKVFLKEKGIPFRWVEHKAVYTIEEMEELGLEKMEETAKNLFLRDQKGKNHFLVVIWRRKAFLCIGGASGKISWIEKRGSDTLGHFE